VSLLSASFEDDIVVVVLFFSGPLTILVSSTRAPGGVNAGF